MEKHQLALALHPLICQFGGDGCSAVLISKLVPRCPWMTQFCKNELTILDTTNEWWMIMSWIENQNLSTKDKTRTGNEHFMWRQKVVKAPLNFWWSLLGKMILEMMKCQIANLSSFCWGLLQSLSWLLSRLRTPWEYCLATILFCLMPTRKYS